MLPQEIIIRKRDGLRLGADEIGAFVAGITSGRVEDSQIAALAMAVIWRGLETDERMALTLAMRDSGKVLRWDLPGPVVDKHSTGGVGDNVSLVLAPALAACGAFVPMISGRGLGHTGGTLDKFDSIPGYDTAPDEARFRKVVAEAGCAVIGQTAEIAPADRRFYAVRDVTGTVESRDLITASILSKKLAAGLDALVLDVKTGSGAFMGSEAEARLLAESLVSTANAAGCPTAALVTDMEEPLASAAGNALEMRNACDLLTGAEIDGRLWDLVLELGGTLLALSGLAPDAGTGARRIGAALQGGAAAERFGRMVTALGGPADLLDRYAEILPAAPVVRDVFARGEGFVTGIDTRGIGLAVVRLGGGRSRRDDVIDPAVGFDRLSGLGLLAGPDAPIARVHAADAEAADVAAGALAACYTLGDRPLPEADLVRDRLG